MDSLPREHRVFSDRRSVGDFGFVAGPFARETHAAQKLRKLNLNLDQSTQAGHRHPDDSTRSSVGIANKELSGTKELNGSGGWT